MKKTGSSKLATVLFVGFSLLAFGNSAGQQGQKNLSQININSLIANLKLATGLAITVSDSLPTVMMLQEPEFTAGDTNRVFWDPLPEKFEFRSDSISLSACRILMLWGDSPGNLSVAANIDPDQIFFNFTGMPWQDTPIYYSAQLYLPNSSSGPVASVPSSIVSSRQDVDSPVVGKMEINAGNDNMPASGWFGAQDTILVKYYGLADSAGLSSAFLRGDFGENSYDFIKVPDGQRSTTPDSGNFAFLSDTLGSKKHTVVLGACDAAYSENSHGEGKSIAAVWTIAGNCADSLASAVIKIDLDAPIWDLESVKDVYTSDDLLPDGTIKISSAVRDPLSGVETNSVSVQITNSQTLCLGSIQRTGGDADGQGVDIEQTIECIPPTGIDKVINLLFIASDRAGNKDSTEREVRVLINPAHFTFELYDLSSYPDSAQPGFTNEAIVGWRFLDQNFEENDVEKIMFTGSSTNVVEWAPSMNKRLNLSDLFGTLATDSIYTARGAVKLVNGIESNEDALPSASIKFDNVSPEIDSLSVTDVGPSPLPAAPGFTDSAIVDLFLSASSDVDSFAISGDVQSVIIDDVEMPASAAIAFRQNLQLGLIGSGDPEKNINVQVRDRAGNWSRKSPKSIIFIDQNIKVEILGEQPQKVSEVNIFDTLQVKITCEHPEYLRLARTKTHTDTLDGKSFQNIPFYVDDSKFDFIEISDLAGSISNTDTVFFEVLLPPVISLTLYDYSEFDFNSIATSDSRYTDDESNDYKKIIAIVTLDAGSWSTISLAFENENLPEKGDSVTSVQPIFKYEAPIDSVDFDCEIRMKAQATNAKGDTSEIVSAAIRYDNSRPELITFSATPDASGETVNVNYHPSDSAGCPGGVAGIVIKDSVEATGEQQWFYFPRGAVPNITPLNTSGVHYLIAFVVDSADVDQNVGEQKGRSRDILAPLGDIGHASKTRKVPLIWQTSSVAEAYNFPNPFNPEKESTSFYLPAVSSRTMDVRIYDLFGNLVLEKPNVPYSPGGFDSEKINSWQWNGRNGRDNPVASGTYIAIIKPDNGATLKPIKIGVWRKD